MSVIVKGMRMPENCIECMNSDLRTAIKCTKWTEISAGRRENERALSCPLVELPEHHGRLIDADALAAESLMDGAYGYVGTKEIYDAPTIVEVG